MSVSVEIDKSAGIGTLRCKVCSRTFSARINHLEGPIDVYSEWVDACEAVNREERSRQTSRPQRDAGDYSDGGGSSDGRGYEDEAAPSRGRVGMDRNSRAPATARPSKSRVPPPAPALDKYGVPQQLSDDESDIDDF
ncbi:hypothetical protein H4R20_006115 [Coemansia guatemalensis]|uniref:Transcription elongation factor 1 homolog n=1 Tax=Coemansia guatemalensis TaxID=2761395 RepID=A0A9W8LQI3_9FUNG|nr:hypothetical protein H4R20_006115 [Coemansia guatemalensis]